jgi:isopentenyl-diphosphate delta-isomerase type 1
MAATEQVILVDLDDKPLGTAEKLDAHRKGLCHRAFSVFIYRQLAEFEVLLQKRAKEKYHSGGLWTNTCCSHPRPGEETRAAAERRLLEEMGLRIALESTGQFHYIAHFENGLTENELDHVFVGELTNQEIRPNPSEVEDYRWVAVSDLRKEIAENPSLFTPWVLQALGFVDHYQRSLFLDTRNLGGQSSLNQL